MLKQRPHPGLSLLLIAAIATGCAASTVAPTPVLDLAPPSQPPATEARQKPTPPDMALLQQQLKEYIATLDGTYGVYVIDLESRRAAAVNAGMPFPTASTFKLPMVMHILHQTERGEADLKELLTYSEDDWEEGTGTLQDSVAVGDTFTVRRLIELAITQSDNIATNMLLRRFGRENVFAYMHEMGGKVTLYEEGVTGTTPREMAGYLQQAYSKRAIANSDLRRFLIDQLTKTAFHDRIEAGIPKGKGAKVAHKVGTLPGVVNDVGLVLLPKHSFVLAIYSIDVEEEAAVEAIAQMTRLVFEFEQSRR